MTEETVAIKIDAIILDDEQQVCDMLEKLFQGFYSWGEVHAFTDYDEAVKYCKQKHGNLAVFVLDVFLENHTAFDFLEEIKDQYPMAADDSIIITGRADHEVAEKCMQARVTHLLEKPVRTYAIQFAVMSIIGKYQRFAPRLLNDPEFAASLVPLDGES